MKGILQLPMILIPMLLIGCAPQQLTVEQHGKRFAPALGVNESEIRFLSYADFSFVKEFKLRGVPTTILINKNSEEFARIAGAFDFENKQFIKWLSKYD